MQRATFPLFALVAFVLLGASPALAPGSAAPAFLLENPGGDPFTIASFAGKPLVLNVFASWCPPCLVELPSIIASARKNRGRVAFLGIDEQEPLTIGKAFAREMRIPYPIAFDHGQFAATYGASALPETVFLDRRGRIAAIVHGAMTPGELATDLAKIAPATATPART
jgi:thiol-disulfide isomerase/thioredoxin